jgi:aminopeptidase N
MRHHRLIPLPARIAATLLSMTLGEPGAAQTSRSAQMGPGVSQSLAAERRTTVQQVRYALSLDLTAADSASGAVRIQFRTNAARDVTLDFRGTAVHSVEANGAALSAADRTVWNRAHLRIPAARIRRGNNIVVVRFVSPIAPAGTSIIRSRDQSDGRDYLYTLLVPADANLLFPCFDQPDIKARVTLSLTTPPGWRALGNGALIGADTTSTQIRHRFAETEPISSYLIAFAAGPWATVTRNVAIRPGEAPQPVSLWLRQSRLAEVEGDTLIAMNARALVWLGEWFGVPYAFGKYDALLAPAFPFGGMEHPGAVFYNEQSFIYRERPTLTQLRGREATIYHEVAHQWFGDYLTMQWFDDLWLKEGFATYMAARMQAAVDPSANAWKTFHLRNKPVAYATDATAGTTPIWQALDNLDQAKSNYGPIVYNKAPSVLKQLNWLVGDSAFQRGVRATLREHPYGNATWRDLLRTIGRAAGRDLSSYGTQWMLRPGMPIVEQQVTVRDGRIVRLLLTQRPAQPDLSGPAPWPLSLRVRLHYPGGVDRVFDVESSARQVEVRAARGLPAPAYVFANDGDHGYALVLPDSASVRWLETRISTVRDDLARAMLWGALWDLVREARLDPVRFVSLALRELPTERDEEIAGTLVGRVVTALQRYAPGTDAVRRDAMRTFEAGAADTTRAYGQRKQQLDATIDLARTSEELAQLDRRLDTADLFGLPLRAPTRWAVITQLIARNAPTAEARLAAESRRDSTSDGRRLAYVASAARPSAAVKRELFARWFADTTLNEQWVTSSLRAFHDPDQAAMTKPLLDAALDSLPWIQRNRRIFFLGSWLGATIGGQGDAEALATIDRWLAAHPALAPDLRRKVLQSRDELERTVRIRAAFASRPSP